MPEHPAEIPEGGEGGSSGGFHVHGGIGGPNELPPPDYQRASVVQLVNEIFRMRARINTIENAMLAQKFSGGMRAMSTMSFTGGPNELPEGGEGGGGVFHGGIHGEIHEIAELPISRLVAEFSMLATRFTQFERNIAAQLQTITKRLDAMQK